MKPRLRAKADGTFMWHAGGDLWGGPFKSAEAALRRAREHASRDGTAAFDTIDLTGDVGDTYRTAYLFEPPWRKGARFGSAAGFRGYRYRK